MSDVISHNLYLIKEHLGIFKAANNFDILDPANGNIIMQCREPNLGFFTKLLRFSDYKRMTPFDIQVTTPEGERIVRLQRGISLFLSTVTVTDENNHVLGYFKQKLFSIGGKFDVLDKDENTICRLQGKWSGWDFRFSQDDKEYARVTKKWSGLGRELFTSADNYILEINEDVSAANPVRKLIIAAVMCIDMVLKE
ncbi:MAG: phospholipid scramblase-related protein [Bermanella sp.]